ncbi:tRNA (adenosine(37)-N6)-dimethylallyltransferase MiaA [Qipengyuania huizhouensis]|uniref:tRNA (adenosine(37)-N6)-dimethylallyltransferase MiaA n=1 Tax=Qipengyuania huizhouensis TaxID=2867245 RepID=UPI0018488FEC|nr:tRNA (adenosine(37)-N6)-dimethylallyltransferase MiaA [Qipengyuania huizhouensis]MBA4764893.1 tRNA (adenosine(37)-N6)-dimethylallyltransferase MiaA [Erythrobacter sp.]MBX7461362.1 tRNA (adenosine(37)-N6)-dimethylallyltransferase MiaA [Qipengyuania huizhouensis]
MIIDKSPDLPPLALIAGPTASGKSDLAVKLGQRIEAQGRKAVVINADSAQVYADLRVLSARPGEEEMGEIEHRLFGAWDGADACSAADWATAAKREIAELHAEGAVPILCGGTGLYMRTLLEGIAPVPGIKPAIREQVRALSQVDARAALEIEDPEAAARLASADASRTTRALEVIRSTGRTLKDWQARKTGGIGDEIALYPLVLLPEREWLYERCDRRFAMMLEHGAIEEVEALLARNLDPALPVMRAIGVPEIAGLLQGDLSRAQAIVSGQTATRQYAKRQYTWFRNQPPESWSRDDNKTIDEYDIFVSLLRRMS